MGAGWRRALGLRTWRAPAAPFFLLFNIEVQDGEAIWALFKAMHYIGYSALGTGTVLSIVPTKKNPSKMNKYAAVSGSKTLVQTPPTGNASQFLDGLPHTVS